jgi:hypothetical protein
MTTGVEVIDCETFDRLGASSHCLDLSEQLRWPFWVLMTLWEGREACLEPPDAYG